MATFIIPIWDVTSNTSSDGQFSSTNLPIDEQYHKDMSSCPPPLDEQVNESLFQQLSRSMATIFISIQVVSSNTPSSYEKLSSTILLVGAQYQKDISSCPLPLDEQVSDSFL